MRKILYLFAFLLTFSMASNAQLKVVASGNAIVGGSDPGAGNFKTLGTSEIELALDANSGNPDFSMQVQNVTKAQFKYIIAQQGLQILADDASVTNGGLGANKSAMFIKGTNRFVHIGGNNPQVRLDVEGSIHYSGSISNTSDRRLKKDVNDFTYGLKEVMGLNPISYHYTGEAGTSADKAHVGIFAQELQTVAPELVGSFEHVTYVDQSKAELDSEADLMVEKTEKYLNIQESAIKYMLINAVKEQQEVIDAQDVRIAKLEAMVETLVNNTGGTSSINNTEVTLQGQGETMALEQNRPNPFDGSTVIDYSVPKTATNAQIIIFNSAGSLVKSIPVDGSGELSLKVENMPSGNYSYTLVVDGVSVDTKSMVITK